MPACRSALLQRRGALVNLTGDERTLSLASPAVEAFLDSLPTVAGNAARWEQRLAPHNEALVVPTQVGGCGECLAGVLALMVAGHSVAVRGAVGAGVWDECLLLVVLLPL